MKNKEIFTEDEMGFLKNTIERKTIATETNRINLIDFEEDYIQSQFINGKNYLFLSDRAKSSDISLKKEKLIKALNDCDDFNIEIYGGGYDDPSEGTLVTYNLMLESDEIFVERLKILGRDVLKREKMRLSRLRKLETRQVLFEKTIIKKKRGRPKMYPPRRVFPEIRWHT